MAPEYSYLNAVILGVVQGITEFLPVSSDGHLTLAAALLGLKGPKLFFNVMLHAGTLLAVLVVYARDLGAIFAGLWRGLGLWLGRRLPLPEVLSQEPELRLGLWVVLATFPTGVIGLALKDHIDPLSTVAITGGFLLVSGALLWFAGRRREQEGRALAALTWRDAVGVGIAQGLAVLPGLSRSGSTIATGLFLGLDRQAAARYSFLLSIPAVLGAIVLEVGEAIRNPPAAWGPIVVGALVSLVVGLLALRLLLWIVRGGKVHLFTYYLLPLGLLAIGVGLWLPS